jgi:hypothetical protein
VSHSDASMGRAFLGTVGLVSVLASMSFACDAKPTHATKKSTAATSTSPPETPRSLPSTAPTSLASATLPPAFLPVDAGPSSCRLAYGPVQQSWMGEATLVPTSVGIDVVTHHNGAPTVRSIASATARPGKVARSEPVEAVSSPACAAAGAYLFCMESSGAIRRTPRGGGAGSIVARARFGTRFDAESLGDVHAVVAFLAERKTTEGALTEAYAVIDEAPPVLISEEGSGATSVTLSPRDTDVLAMMIDARTAMTPVHARTLSVSGDGHLVVGADAVVFVGGTSERRTAGVLATPRKGRAFGLVPIAGEEGFGMAAIAIDDEPRVDEPTHWSLYPNGLDPAPIAATVQSSPIRIARVRPLDARPDSARVIELGQLGDAGAFDSLGFLSTTGPIANLAVAPDSQGALWIHYTDAAGSWIERRMCP